MEDNGDKFIMELATSFINKALQDKSFYGQQATEVMKLITGEVEGYDFYCSVLEIAYRLGWRFDKIDFDNGESNLEKCWKHLFASYQYAYTEANVYLKMVIELKDNPEVQGVAYFCTTGGGLLSIFYGSIACLAVHGLPIDSKFTLHKVDRDEFAAGVLEEDAARPFR